MASPLPPNPHNLNGPPPSPQQGPPIVPQAPQLGPMPGGEQPSEADGIKGLVRLGMELDRGLTALAYALPQVSTELRQAKQLIKTALQKGLNEVPAQSLSLTPTEVGSQFPGSMGGSVNI